MSKDLHDAIMNLPATPDKTAGANFVLAYKMGHRDARHAAAELVGAEQSVADMTDAEIESAVDAARRKWDAGACGSSKWIFLGSDEQYLLVARAVLAAREGKSPDDENNP